MSSWRRRDPLTYQAPEPRHCTVPGCAIRPYRRLLFCGPHWQALPDDMRERVRDAHDGDPYELECALHAASEVLRS